MTRLSLFSVSIAVLALAGCPEDAKVTTNGITAPKASSIGAGTPSSAIVALQVSAKAGDVTAFKAGLSKNFVLTIERLQEVSVQKAELKGAFKWGTFMSTLGNQAPQPTEEIVKGSKAIVRAVAANGTVVSTEMVLEDGKWKMEVPGGIVKALDNLDHMASLVKGDAIKAGADIPRGGGGQGGRLKALAADATDAQKSKAAALDAFDMGDVSGSLKALEKAHAVDSKDEELVVALGRAQVQMGEGEKAVKTFQNYLKVNAKSYKTKHYLGMAYMMANKPGDAANEWIAVGQLNPEYAKLNRLDKRAAIAQGIAQGKTPQEAAKAAGAIQNPLGAPKGGGAASQPK